VLAQRSPPATRKVDLLTIDRIRDPPTPHELKHHADINVPQLANVYPLRAQIGATVRVFVKSPILPKSTIRASNCHPGQPRIRSYLFEANMYAADVLRAGIIETFAEITSGRDNDTFLG
jgi:hypothetical protein